MPSAYDIPDPLPWASLAGPLATAEDTVARLDERLAKSPIRDGWIARTHFADACASLWLEGELVHLEDLVLRDAGMDIRTPTHELTRAHAVLRARRRIAASDPGWALSAAGLDGLRGRGGQGGRADETGARSEEQDKQRGIDDEDDQANGAETARSFLADESLAAAFAAVDAAITRTDQTLAGESATQAKSSSERDSLVYDLDWDEDEHLTQWKTVVDQTRTLPPALAAAIAADAWSTIAPLQHTPWLGRLLAANLLRARGKTRQYLACLHHGLKSIPREERRPRDPAARLTVQLAALAAAAEAGLKDHDRWITARILFARKLIGRRATSHLPALLDYVMTRPIVSAGMIATELKITPRAATDLVAQLGLREATGRGRYRAWGIP